jgi:flavin-dependent dehydrogenase
LKQPAKCAEGASMTKPATDLLIVGAGVAGAAAALAARQMGLSVTVLETRAAPGMAPGETLPPGIEAIFNKLGVRERVLSANFLRHAGVWVQWDRAPEFQAYGSDPDGPWLGFQTDRMALGALLHGAVCESGAEFLPALRAIRLLKARGRVIGVVTPQEALYARWVIDAAGGRHWLARQLGLPIMKYSPQLISRFGWRQAASSTPHEPTLSTCRDGWHWEAQIDANRTAWCRLHFSTEPQCERQDSGSAGLHDLAGAGARDVTWRIVPAVAGPGYFLLGDAAAVLDPASSHGVLRAMMSGLKAVHGIAQVCRGFAEAAVEGEYRDWMSNWFQHDLIILSALYRKHPYPPRWVLEDAGFARRSSRR